MIALPLTFTLFLALIIIVASRSVAMTAFLIGAVFLPLGAKVVVAGLNFYMFRIIIAAAVCRLLLRGQFRIFRWRSLDTLVVLFILANLTIYTAQWRTADAFTNRLGFLFNALGAYLFLRCSIRSMAQVWHIITILSIILVAVGIFVLIENATGRNAFYLLGGPTEFSEIRDGKLRAQGPFAHSILAGTFGATMLPIFVSLWPRLDFRRMATLAIAACLVIVAVSASSGPVLTCAAGIAGLLMWPWRRYMRVLRWMLAITILSLHLVMNAPVWALIGRASVFGSSSSDHRFELVDSFIRNVSEWWLLGTKSTLHWGWGMQDVSNNYVRVGVDGGLISLLLLICIIVVAFKMIGALLKSSASPPGTRPFVWGLGVALSCHVVAFFGVNYWDQSILLWYLLLATIASIDAFHSVETQTPGRQASGLLMVPPCSTPNTYY